MQLDFSTDKTKLDIDTIIYFLHQHSYWAQNRPKKAIKRSIENSVCVGVYESGKQIGFGRIVTDYATVYYLADIFIIPAFQNRGIGKKLMNYICGLPELASLRGILTTQTAHSFYEEFGFSRANEIVRERIMVKGQ